MAYNDRKIKLDSSQKDINKKFKNEIEDTDQKIYWYIKFSLPLEAKSVSSKTMYVMDTKGNLFNTSIIYNKELELIVIEPLEIYKEDEYYILHVNSKVKGENGKKLNRDVHILFKIKGGVVCEFKELGENVVIPKLKDRKRLKKVKKRNQVATKSRVYSFQKENKNLLENLDKDKLPYASIKFNPIVAILGVPLFLIGVFLQNQFMIAIGGVIGCLGFAHIIKQLLNRELRSNIYYNMGVINFNKEKFKKAHKKFKKALVINSYNEFAEYGINKLSFFL